MPPHLPHGYFSFPETVMSIVDTSISLRRIHLRQHSAPPLTSIRVRKTSNAIVGTFPHTRKVLVNNDRHHSVGQFRQKKPILLRSWCVPPYMRAAQSPGQPFSSKESSMAKNHAGPVSHRCTLIENSRARCQTSNLGGTYIGKASNDRVTMIEPPESLLCCSTWRPMSFPSRLLSLHDRGIGRLGRSAAPHQRVKREACKSTWSASSGGAGQPFHSLGRAEAPHTRHPETTPDGQWTYRDIAVLENPNRGNIAPGSSTGYVRLVGRCYLLHMRRLRNSGVAL